MSPYLTHRRVVLLWDIPEGTRIFLRLHCESRNENTVQSNFFYRIRQVLKLERGRVKWRYNFVKNYLVADDRE